MAFTKQQIKWTLIILAAVAFILIMVYVFRCSIFNGLSSCVEDPNKTNTPVPPSSPTSTWVPETFPLNIGMYGTKIKALQAKLGITADGKFGPITKGAITAKGYAVPLSQADYDKIVGTTTSGSGSSTKTIDDFVGTYINSGTINNVVVRYISDNTEFKKYGLNANIGRLGTNLGNGYHRIFEVAGYNDSLGQGLKISDDFLKAILKVTK